MFRDCLLVVLALSALSVGCDDACFDPSGQSCRRLVRVDFEQVQRPPQCVVSDDGERCVASSACPTTCCACAAADGGTFVYGQQACVADACTSDCYAYPEACRAEGTPFIDP